MTTPKTVSVVIPTHRRPRSVERCLAAWHRVEWPALQIVVVDDGGNDATAAVARRAAAYGTEVAYVSQDHRGAAAARNTGADLASGDLLLFSDDDVIVPSDHVSRHVAGHAGAVRTLLNGVSRFSDSTVRTFRRTPFGRYRLSLEESFEAAADWRTLSPGRYETPSISARNLSISSEVFGELGGFDESFPHAGAEDQDLSLRARALGCQLVRDHSIVVENEEPTTSLADFCRREEQSAQTAVVLALKHPQEIPRMRIYVENRRVAPGDPPRTVIKKTVKRLASAGPILESLDRAGELADRVPGPSLGRHRLYAWLVGLHIFRGVRAASALRDGASSP